MVAVACRFQVKDGQPIPWKAKYQVWDAGQDDSSLGVYKVEGGVV